MFLFFLFFIKIRQFKTPIVCYVLRYIKILTNCLNMLKPSENCCSWRPPLPLFKAEKRFVCFVVFLFMWWKVFCGCHKTICFSIVVLCFVCFSTAVAVWHQGFSPHALHSSMLKPRSCGCGSMYHLFFSSQEKKLIFLRD